MKGFFLKRLPLKRFSPKRLLPERLFLKRFFPKRFVLGLTDQGIDFLFQKVHLLLKPFDQGYDICIGLGRGGRRMVIHLLVHPALLPAIKSLIFCRRD